MKRSSLLSVLPASTTTAFLTIIAMFAFAANSLLCRMALGQGLIDAASFTSVRMMAGALTLGLIALPRWRSSQGSGGQVRSAIMLFVYMSFFSFAYLSLAAGTGALILFAAVQLTMFVAALKSGESFPTLSRVGLLMAVAGLVYLVSPGLTAPDPVGALLMAIAGVAWGGYSLLGRKTPDALQVSARNFIYGLPLVLGMSLLFIDQMYATPTGLLLAILSGAIASGIGYVIWYAALAGLTATRAATVQLSVPVIAAIAGVLLLAEPLTIRLVLASLLTLGGVALVLGRKAG